MLLGASHAYAQEEVFLPGTPPPPSGEASLAEGEPEECLDDVSFEGCVTVRIDAVQIEGMFRTHRSVVLRELLFSEGGVASMRQIEESMTRLRNLGLFRAVSYDLMTQLVASPDGDVPLLNPDAPGRVLVITVDERWTLMPGFSFSQGGDLSSLRASIYDVNAFGRYIELGVQYGRIGRNETFLQLDGAANSFVLWARDPRFLDSFWRVGVDLWSYTRLRAYYAPDGAVEGGFLLQRLIAVLRAEREFSRWLRVGGTLELMSDSFTLDLLSDAVAQAQVNNFGAAPESNRAVIARGVVRLGRVNRDDFYYDGWDFSAFLGHSDPLIGATLRFTQLEAIGRAYKRIPWNGNLAFRARVATTNATAIQHIYYLGGLDRVRGYRDSSFRGQQYWSLNAEYRVAPFANPWVVVQPIVFADAGSAGDGAGTFARVDAASVGGGVRLILPRVYGFVARFDYAFPLVNVGGAGFSFGAQQFF